MKADSIKNNLLLIMMISLMFAITSCKMKAHDEGMAGPDEYYTCSMDPQVIENKAGNCPICHMKLIKVKKNNLKAGQTKLSAQQIKLANITYDTLHVHELSKEVTLTGRVTVDQSLSIAISSRLNGRVSMLAVKNVGDYIINGQLLYEIYSEELNAIQQEYILATQNAYSADFETAAKNKLLLYGMGEAQISQLKTSKEVLQNVPVYAAVSGYLSELSIAEGDYVSTGTTLFRLSSLNSLWVEAQVYLPYLHCLQMGTEADFSIPAAGEKLFSGKVIFIDPQVQSPERFVLARFKMTDPSNLVKPGMLANITLKTEKKKALAIPVEAIIQDSKGANVWILNQDGVFENKMVMTGMQDSKQVEITDGLKEGDVVVVTGAYLLNSEYIFKRGASPMKGQDNMPGMKM